jgi:hypothetical protein
MTTTGIQGLSSYKMQMQSLSSRISELYKRDDNNSLSAASALNQEKNSIQRKIVVTEGSNNEIIIENYNQKAEKESISVVESTFDVKA